MRAPRVPAIGILASALLLAAVGPATAAAPHPAVTVDLAADGDATVATTYTFDLDSPERRAAFRSIRDNESVRSAYAARYERRLRSVAAATAERTGRDMSVGAASVAVRTEGSTGVVELSAPWRNLAAVDGDRLTLSEPFASGFVPDRRFVVVLPDGYSADASPAPDERADGRLSWAAGSDLSGFELTASPSGPSGGFGPGVGAAGALVALLAGVALYAARR